MKNYSGHIIFDNNFQWKDLEKYFPDMWEIIEEESKLNVEDKQFDDILLNMNLEEIRKNKKPFGYRRENSKFKMIFPQDKKEITIHRNTSSLCKKSGTRFKSCYNRCRRGYRTIRCD